MINSQRGHIPCKKGLDLNKFTKVLKRQRDELSVDAYAMLDSRLIKMTLSSQKDMFSFLNRGRSGLEELQAKYPAMSATECEYIAASEAAMEAVWIRKFILGLGFVPTKMNL
ncbi:hypothetical protein Tco_1090726 [Tanacetum coccineum]|uniref:Uncharacterized protein n=1 Tax=Tanacetum coccineum TaxID=301880 RepID=A0ABQ5I506_9ASTR